MNLLTPEAKLDACDDHFTEIGESFTKKFQILIDDCFHAPRAAAIHTEFSDLADAYSKSLRRRVCDMKANAVLEEINVVTEINAKAEELLTALSVAIEKARARERKKKLTDLRQTLLINAGCVVIGLLIIGGYVTMRYMAG